MTDLNTEIVTDSNGVIDTQYYINRASELRAAYIKAKLAKLAQLFRQAPKPRTRFLSTTTLVLGRPA